MTDSILFPRGPCQRSVLHWLIPLALVNGILAGLRWPMLWGPTHLLFDYHFGFGKRGLVGAVLQLAVEPPYHYLSLAMLGFVVFALWLMLLASVAWRPVRADTGVAAAMVLFLLSAGFACLVDDMG
jgi:hypothetical protein